MKNVVEKSTIEEKDEYPYKHLIIGSLIIAGVEPSAQKKYKIFEPHYSGFTVNVFTDFLEVQKQTGKLVSKMNKLNLSKIKISFVGKYVIAN